MQEINSRPLNAVENFCGLFQLIKIRAVFGNCQADKWRKEYEMSAAIKSLPWGGRFLSNFKNVNFPVCQVVKHRLKIKKNLT